MVQKNGAQKFKASVVKHVQTNAINKITVSFLVLDLDDIV